MKFNDKIEAIRSMRDTYVNRLPPIVTTYSQHPFATTLTPVAVGLQDAKEFVEACMELSKESADRVGITEASVRSLIRQREQGLITYNYLLTAVLKKLANLDCGPR